MPRGRIVAAGAALAAYALLSHLLMVHAPRHPWSVAVLFGPLLLAVAAGGWRRRHAPTLLLCAALAALLALVVAHGGVQDMHRMYVLQHAGIHVALAATFAATLRGDNTPLITALAARVHRELTPAMREYTRRLTLAWALYFVAMVNLSFALYVLAPWSVWSLFGNLVTPLAAVAFFVGEYVWRYQRHPDFERVTLTGAWQAWQGWQGAERERERSRERGQTPADGARP